MSRGPATIAALIALMVSPVSGKERQDQGQSPARTAWRKIDVNAGSPFEAVGVADIDRDGKLDIFSGDSWYRAPRWQRHHVRDVPPGDNPHYHQDFGNIPFDVNRDGRIDFITCSYEGKNVSWIEQPRDRAARWITHEIDRPGPSETCRLMDLDQDGRPELLPAVMTSVVYYELGSDQGEVAWKKHLVFAGREGAGHGIGVGDINGDGRLDLITPTGWHQQPSARDRPWRFHRELDLGPASIWILARDIDGDGKSDIVWGMGHNYGLFWLRQGQDADGRRTWTRGTIDATISQVHTLVWADLDGRGEPALVTGRRIYAHENDPGATDAGGLYAFRFDRRQARWTKQTIYEGQPAVRASADAQERWAQRDFPPGTAGTGLHIEAVDLDADGDVDLACPGKTGLYLFENPRLGR